MQSHRSSFVLSKYLLLGLVSAFHLAELNVHAAEFPVKLNESRSLEYVLDERGNRVPDFSHCGYDGGKQVPPDVPAAIVVAPAAGDDGARIQAALDQVGELPTDESGFRGAVQLLSGEYQVEGDLRLTKSGVVLRGLGASEQGTQIIATGTDRRPLIRLGEQANSLSQDPGAEAIPVTSIYVPVGATKLTVASAETFKVGERVLVTRPCTEEWVDRLGTRAPGVGWRAGRYDIHWQRRIVSIDGDQIELDAPITTALDEEYGGGTVQRLSSGHQNSRIGIENLAFVSAYDESKPLDEEHSWFGVVANNAEDFWIRRVRFQHFAGGAVLLRENTHRATVEDCLSLQPVSELGGYRRHSFFTQGGLTLFLRCYAEHGRHDFSVGHCAPGPNAFVNCYAANAHGDSGPLEGWASGVLYDNVRIDGNDLSLVNRWRQPPGAGWSAANCVLWQCQAAVIRAFRPPTANNWVLGYWAEPMGDASFFGQSDFVKPISLYQAQVADRLGNERAEAAGPFLLKPVAATRPSLAQAADFVASSDEPKKKLRELIEDRLEAATLAPPATSPREPLATAPQNEETLTATSPIEIRNGWITLDGRVLTGGHVNPTWWRGTIRPLDAPGFGPSISRFAPGRYGVGLTDELADVAATMVEHGQVAYDHHYGLWYDRRRDDHLMVRRADGNVAPPYFEQPFARTGVGKAWDGLSKYDLTRPNPWYYKRLHDFAEECDQHGLVLFHQHYFQHNILEAGAHWADCPWRPANNVNEVSIPEPPPYVGDKRIFLAHQFYNTNNPHLVDLHRGYIRQSLKQLAPHSNVIHSISAEYTGPLDFTRFWIDTAHQWQEETGHDALISLAATKDVQDAILEDNRRNESIDVVDIRYWCYGSSGDLYAPAGGMNLAPRQHLRRMRSKRADFASIAQAIREYRVRFPEKAVTYYADMYCNSPRDGWAVLMGGGSLANVPPLPEQLAEAIVAMAPQTAGQGSLRLGAPEKEYLLYLLAPQESFTLKLPPNQRYELTQIDPKSGTPSESISLVSNGDTIQPDFPVLWLKRAEP